MTNFFRTGMFTISVVAFAQMSAAGGWEASTLDTSFMYNDGNYAEAGTAAVTYNVKATTQANTAKTKMAKNQSRTSLAVKTSFGSFDIGLASYMSGAIQLSGADAHKAGCSIAGAAVALCSVVPSGDVVMNSLAVLGRYKLSDEISLMAGANRYSIASGSTVTALTGHYEVSGDEIVPTLGAAYEMSDIALRVELLVQSKTKISNFKAQSKSPLTALADVSGENMTIPQTIKLNFQSGIAENTLLFGSIHQATWKDAQIDIPAIGSGTALGGVDPVSSDFANRTTYSIGIGRKLTEQFSGLISFTSETGGGKTTADPFTLRNGFQSVSLGGRYTAGNMTISGGYNYTMPGDVDLAHASGLTASYKNNNVSAIGLKVGFSF
jgi:hypothetical protein